MLQTSCAKEVVKIRIGSCEMERLKIAIATAVSLFCGTVALAGAQKDGVDHACTQDAMLVFDASGSMASVGYNEMEIPRIHQALDAVRSVLPRVAPYRRIGLLVYGPGPKDACSNVDLRLRPQSRAAARILGELERVVPDGNTPLTVAVQNAAEVLDYRKTPGTVVLIADGDETCGGRPCQIASRLASEGEALTVHVIGFKVRAKFFQWQSQSKRSGGQTAARCLADQNGGKYISAESTEDLVAALQETLGCPLLTQRRRPPSMSHFALVD